MSQDLNSSPGSVDYDFEAPDPHSRCHPPKVDAFQHVLLDINFKWRIVMQMSTSKCRNCMKLSLCDPYDVKLEKPNSHPIDFIAKKPGRRWPLPGRNRSSRSDQRMLFHIRKYVYVCVPASMVIEFHDRKQKYIALRFATRW